MPIDIAALKTEFNTLSEASAKLIETVATAKRSFSKEENETKDRNFARMKEIQDVLKAHAEQAKFAAQNGTAQLPDEPQGRQEQQQVENRPAHIEVGQTFGQVEKAKAEHFKNVLSQFGGNWVRSGDASKFATITTASASGLMVPQTVLPPIAPNALNVVRDALAVTGAQSFAYVSTPGTENLSLPIFTGDVADADSSETETDTPSENPPDLSESVDLSVSTKSGSSLGQFESGQSWFSVAEIMAVPFDLMGYAVPSLQNSVELAWEKRTVQTIAGDTGVTTSTATLSTSALNYANLNAVINSLPKRYMPYSFIVLSRQAYACAAGLVTSTGFPILTPDAQNTRLQRINGVPVFRSDYLSDFGANNVVGFVGSFMGARVREVSVNRLERYENYTGRPGQIGLNLIKWVRFGYSPKAFAKLKCPAS